MPLIPGVASFGHAIELNAECHRCLRRPVARWHEELRYRRRSCAGAP
jgi:hypothetical protein